MRSQLGTYHTGCFVRLKPIEDNSLCELKFRWWCITCWWVSRFVGRGVRSNPPLGLKRFYTPPGYDFKFPAVCKWSTSFTAIENHCRPNKFGCSYAPCLFMEDQQMNADHARKRFMQLLCIRTHISTCIYKSLFQALESSPVVLNSLESYHLSENAGKCTVYYGSLQASWCLIIEKLFWHSLHSISASVTPPVVWPTVAFSFVEIQRLKYLGAHLLYTLTLILVTHQIDVKVHYSGGSNRFKTFSTHIICDTC